MTKKRWLIALSFLYLVHIVLFLFEPDLAFVAKALKARVQRPPPPVSWLDQGLTPAASTSIEGGDKPALTFVAVGHMRTLLPFPDLVERLAHQITAESPDYVFLLGDFTVDGNTRQWHQMEAFLEAIPNPVFACPGNHEYQASWAFSPEEGIARYRNHFEATHRFVPAQGANFILIDSSDSLNTLSGYLESYLDQCNREWPTILLSHHQLWAERPESRWFYKSFSPSEILPLLHGRVQHVLAGDFPGDGKGGHGLSYSFMKMEEMSVYPVGIGYSGYGHPVVYARGEVVDGEVSVSLRFLDLDPNDSWNRIRVGDAHTAFRGLSLGRKIRLYFWYLGNLRIPRGRVPLYAG